MAGVRFSKETLSPRSPTFRGWVEKYGRSPEVTTALGFLELRLGRWPASERYFRTALGGAFQDLGRQRAATSSRRSRRENEEQAYARLLRVQEASPDHPLIETLRFHLADKT